MPACAAPGCRNRTEGSFHNFPVKNAEIFQAWIKAMQVENFVVKKAHRLCSLHFTASDFLFRPGSYRRQLKPNAVPSIFGNNLNSKAPVVKTSIQGSSDEPKKPSHILPDQHLKEASAKSGNKGNISMCLKVANNCKKIRNPIPIASASDRPPVSYGGPTPKLSLCLLPVKVAYDAAVQTEGLSADSRNKEKLRKIKTLKQKLRRREQQIANLKGLVIALRGKGLLDEDSSISNQFKGTLSEVFMNELKIKGKSKLQKQCTVLVSSVSDTEEDNEHDYCVRLDGLG